MSRHASITSSPGGNSRASGSDGDVVLSAKFVNRDAACKFECICTDSAPLTVVSLKEGTLTWERNDDFAGNPDLDGCPNNLGKRIFPDLIDKDDAPNAAQRRTVDLVATVKPPVKGATVYFKVWDVDDPFNSLPAYSSMPNVSLIDGDTIGPDNRGTVAVALPWTRSKATEANGKVRVQFTVSMQPGNNYRAGASVNFDAPGQADQTDADESDDQFVGKPGDFAEYKVPLTWSPMLTVWRHLWVERDTMAAPDPTELRVVRAVSAIIPTPGRPGLTTVELAQVGQLRVYNPVFDSVRGNFARELLTTFGISNHYCPVKETFQGYNALISRSLRAQ